MMSPTQAMLWQIWRGWRWGLMLGWAYLLVAAVVARLLPGILRHTSLGETALPDAGQHLAMPCGLILIHVAAVFALTGADVKERGYWRTMFVLPVRTRTLVAWPMLWGCLTLGCVWLVMAGLILRPTGNAVSLVWPIAALALGLTIVQAIQWMPLAQPWLAHVLAVPLLLVVGLGIGLVAEFEVPEPLATGLFLSPLPLTYVACLRSVAAARRDDFLDWKLWNRLVAWTAEWKRPAEHPFRSAAVAQLWFECRSFVWSLPLFVALIVPFSAIVFLPVKILGWDHDIELAWKQLAILLLTPACLAAFVGSQIGNASFPFLAARPVSSAALVRSKFEMAIVSALVANIPVLLIVPLFFVWPSFFDSALQAARAAGTPKTGVVLLLAVVLPLLLSWKGLVESLWLGLTGRAWLINTIPLAIAALIGCGVLIGLGVSVHPGLRALFLALVPWLVGLLLVVKLVVAAFVLYGLVRSQLVGHSVAGLMIGVWALIVAGLCLIAVWLIPGQFLPLSSLIPAMVLFVPFSRLAGATLALEWNRHR